MQFLEIDEHPLNVVQSVRPIRVPRKLNLLPRRQIGIDVLLGQFDFFFNSLDLIGKIQIRILRRLHEFLQLPLQFEQRLFKFQTVLFVLH